MVSECDASVPELDLVHVTAVGVAREIIKSGQIEARRCRVFGRDLVYAFVARPAYRLPDGDRKSDQVSRFPFVFVISPKGLGPPHHVYPFDSGAGHSGRYGDEVDPTIYLEDYELAPDLIAAQRLVTWAFESNSSYFEGDIRPGLTNTLPFFESAARSFLTIAGLAATGSNRPDKRASAIEVAYARHIPLRGNIVLVIMPQQFIEHDGKQNTPVVTALNDMGIPWEAYDWRPNETPESYMDEVTRIMRAFLCRSGQL